MLLSSSKFIRTMMDDFVDQDWFEESAEDEVVKQHPMAVVEQQQQHPQTSPLHVPLENGFGYFHSAQPHGQTEFLELNVPVDEMFFGTAEMTVPQLAELDTQQQQKRMMTNSSSSIVKVVQEVQQKALPLEGHQQLGIQTQIAMGGTPVHQQQNGPAIQQREECFYADWPPTTSSSLPQLATVQPLSTTTTKPQKQNGRDGQQQQRHHDEQEQQQQQQPQQRWTTTTPLGEHRSAYHQQQCQQQQQDEEEYGAGASQTTAANFSSENAFPMTRIVVHDQRVGQFPQQQQPYGFSTDAIDLHQSAIFHSNYASPCNTSNNQNMPTLSVQHKPQQQHQIVVVEEQLLQQRHFSHRMDNIAEFRPIENPSKPTKRPPKVRPSAANTNRKSSTLSGQTHQGVGGGANLDQIATMLFSNSNEAAVQFDHPQRAIEFAQVLEQTKLLREQEEQGIDVRAQLHACEARIAELVQNAMAKQGNGTTSIPTTNNTDPGGTTTTRKKSKAKKKAAPLAKTVQQHNVQTTPNGMMTQPKQMQGVTSTIPVSNGTEPFASMCHQPMVLLPSPEVICQPLTGNTIGSTTTNSNKFKPYSAHSEFPSPSFPPPSSSNSVPKMSASSLANSRKYSSPISADVTPFQQKAATGTKNRLTKQQIKKEEKSEEQMAQERERERARKEEERERRRTKLAGAFSALRASIPTLDYKTPFSDKMDCIKRLLPFGLFAEAELSDEFLQQFDGEMQRHSEFLSDRMEALKERFQSVFFTESLCEMKEQRNLLLRLDAEFEKAQLQKAIEAKGVPFSFPIASSSHLLDWEYDDGWDRNRYRDISPFASPAQSPEKVFQLGEKGEETEMDEEKAEYGGTTQREERIEVEEEDAATAPAKIGTVRLTLPTYSPAEKNTTAGRGDGQHSPSEPKKDEEECKHQHQLMNEQGHEIGFCCPSNEVEVTHLPLAPFSVCPFTLSESPRPFHQKAPPSEVPSIKMIPSPTDIPLNKLLNRDDATSSPSNCDDKLVKTEKDSAKSPFSASENGTENELQHQRMSAKVSRDEAKKPYQETLMSPVKLTIKLDKKNNVAHKTEESNEKGTEEMMNGQEKEEKRGTVEKLEKKRLKAEKKEKKKQAKLEKERAKKEQREREAFGGEQQPNSSSAHLQNGERPPTSLKISLRRLACWKGGATNATPEYCSNLSDHGTRQNGESVDQTNGGGTSVNSANVQMRPENTGDVLKLRIPKLILNRNEHGEKNSGELKSIEHRKKSRKRKSHEEKLQVREEEKEKDASPKKVPRLKIRIGNACSSDHMMTTTTGQTPNAQQQPNTGPDSPSRSEKYPVKNEKPMGKTTHRQVGSPGPSDFYRSNDNNRIQFSPCCSEESDDDELRVRTNELFSKLCQD